MDNKRQAISENSQQYEIRVRGRLGPTICQAFPALSARIRGDKTILSGRIPDQSALYGVLHELEALGVELIELRRTASGSERGEHITRDVPNRLGSSPASV
jgi:hypothetical protein